MIPKIIHFCWFGNNPKSKIFYDCLLSWQKHCPDYKIMEWNEKNTKQFSNVFYKNALRKKRYAFVSDYIRAKVLYKYGGIYFDTDMLVLKPIDKLLGYDFFSGYEVEDRVNFAFFGAMKENHFLKKMTYFYDNNNFDEFNPPIITHSFKNLINSSTLKENEVLFNPDYFYPLTFQDREKDYKLFINEKTYAVHLWDHSWRLEADKNYSYIFKTLKIIFLDYLLYNYPFRYFKKYLKETLINLYRLIKYKSF